LVRQPAIAEGDVKSVSQSSKELIPRQGRYKHSRKSGRPFPEQRSSVEAAPGHDHQGAVEPELRIVQTQRCPAQEDEQRGAQEGELDSAPTVGSKQRGQKSQQCQQNADDHRQTHRAGENRVVDDAEEDRKQYAYGLEEKEQNGYSLHGSQYVTICHSNSPLPNVFRIPFPSRNTPYAIRS